MVSLKTVPDGWADCLAYYGDPMSADGLPNTNYQYTHLAGFALPFPMRQSWDDKIVTRFLAHKKVGHAMVNAFVEILDIYGLENITQYRLDEWGGCWNPRRKTGSTTAWSLHTLGIAVDYLPSMGPYGKAPIVPALIVEAFEKRGFLWLGRAKIRDGHHFQAAGPSY